MKRLILTVALTPILLLQALLVRKTMPLLSEAKGARKGKRGAGSCHLKLMIVGDSAAAGVGVENQSEALSGQILSNLNSKVTVHWQLIACTGSTTLTTIRTLKELPAYDIDAVIMSLGVNDVASITSLKTYYEAQQKLVQLLREKFSARFILVTAIPPLHLFPALPQPLRWYLGTRAERYNRELKHWLGQQPDCYFLEMNISDAPSLMAKDGFHPGSAAYALWGESVAGIIQQEFKLI